MGTKEMFMLALSLILAGAIMMLGFRTFNNSSYNSNKQATSQEMRTYASQLLGWWTTSVELGGAGSLNSNITVAKVSTYLAFTNANNSFTSANAEYRVISAVAASPGVNLTIKALGNVKNKNKYPMVTTVIRFNQATTAAPTITTTLSDATSF